MRDRLWLRPVESLLNGLLAQDPVFFTSLSSYHHFCCAVHFEGLSLDLYITLLPKHIHLSTHPPHRTDCDIYGAPFTLVRMLSNRAARTSNTGITIKGNVDFAEKLLHALHHAELDWEEIIAKASNDHIAGVISHITRLARNFLGTVRQDLNENAHDYLASADSMLITSERVATFLNQVDQLKHDAARLEAHLHKLEQQTRI
jgi:ubiquinone biosynthesis protein UbiJ